MAEIVVIADDLTGAADTGVQFCPHFLHPILISYRHLSTDSDTAASQALAVYTDTRSMKIESARKRVCSLARQLNVFHPKWVFKKVDSCLRGNIGAEVDAIVDEMGFELSFIAPAFPEMGRVTVHDIHLLHGTPVAETELSKDPSTPITESRLSRIVAAQSRYGVGHVDLQFLEGDDDVMAGEIARLGDSGVRHLVFDAKHQAHLDKITRFALGSGKETLLVGSAGLGGSLGYHFERRHLADEDEMPNLLGGYHLLVSGTISDQTRRQIVALLETYPYHVISIPPDHLVDSARRDELFRKVLLARRVLSDNNLIIQINSPETGEARSTKTSSPRRAKQIVEGLGWFVASLLKGATPASLFLSGGDTASAVLGAIGAKGIRLWKEILPGVALGTLVGTPMDRLPVVTKAGGFGDKGTLVALHNHWLRKGRRKTDGS